MSYRDDVEALHQRVTALEQQATSAKKDLDEARHLLQDAEARRRLQVLENIHIAAPCHADWDKMTGDARSRFCGSCEKNVYNLSEMTRAQAEALLIEKEGKLCVRYYQRADGTIITADCPVGVTKRRRRRRVIAATFGAMSAVAAAGAALLHRGQPPMMMGAIAPQAVAVKGELTLEPEQAPPIAVMGDPAPRRPMMGAVAVRPTPKPTHKDDSPRPKMGKIKLVDPTDR